MFATHRATFEALRDLLAAVEVAYAVGPERIDECRVELGSWRRRGIAVGMEEALRRAHLPAARYRHYLALLADAQASSVERRDGGVRIVLFTAGISTSGVVKAVRWSPEPV